MISKIPVFVLRVLMFRFYPGFVALTNMTTILKIAVAVPLRHLFDYLPPQVCDFRRLRCGCASIAPVVAGRSAF